MRGRVGRAALGLLLIGAAGCFTPTFRAVAEPEPPRAYSNDSTYGEAVKPSNLDRPKEVALVPPGQGWTTGDYRVAAVSRGLLAAGMSLVTVLGPDLTDEAALAQAGQSGADVVLRIDEMDWRGQDGRYFLHTAGPELTEVTQGEYDAQTHRVRWKVAAPVLHLRARLLAEGRKTLASYRLRGRLVDLPYPDSYGVSFQWEEGAPVQVEETPVERAYGEEAQRHLEEELLAAIGREMPGSSAPPRREEEWPPEGEGQRR